VPAAGNVSVIAAVHFKVMPLSPKAIVLLDASELTLATNPLNFDVARLPPVKFPVVETYEQAEYFCSVSEFKYLYTPK
jgi:hypothetical protein